MVTARGFAIFMRLFRVETLRAQIDVPTCRALVAGFAKKSGGHTRYRRGTHPIQPPSSTLVGREVLDDWCGDGVHAALPAAPLLTAAGSGNVGAATQPTERLMIDFKDPIIAEYRARINLLNLVLDELVAIAPSEVQQNILARLDLAAANADETNAWVAAPHFLEEGSHQLNKHARYMAARIREHSDL